MRSTALLVSFHTNRIEVQDVRYFVRDASSMSLGAYGQKKNSLMPAERPYLDVFDTIPAPKLAAITWITTPLEAEFADAKGLNLLAQIKIPGLASGQVGVTLSDINSGMVKLLKVSPAGDNELIKQINASPKIIDRLVEYGGKARVLESVVIAVEGAFYNRFAASGKSNGAVMVEGLLVKAEREAHWDRARAVQVKDMVLGYTVAEPQWNAPRDKKKTRGDDLRHDQQGL